MGIDGWADEAALRWPLVISAGGVLTPCRAFLAPGNGTRRLNAGDLAQDALDCALVGLAQDFGREAVIMLLVRRSHEDHIRE